MAFNRKQSRVNCAAQGVRRAVDLILHGAAAELLREDFVSDEREAWKILGAAAIEEIQDHGFVVFIRHTGEAVVYDELEATKDEEATND